MAMASPEPHVSRPIEAETVTNWRMVAFGGGLILLFMVGTAGSLAYLSAHRIAQARETIVVEQPVAPARWPG